MKIPIFLATGLATIVLSADCSAQIYVSTMGKDRNPGTAAQPLPTIERALEIARSRRSSATSDVVTELADGTHRQRHPLRPGDADSGTPGHRLLVRVAAGARPKTPTYAENAFELLGIPGQFYIDRIAARLFFTPRNGEDLHVSDVELPVLESLLELQGTPTQPAHDIAFEWMQFSYATWLAPKGPDGFSEIQADYQLTGADGYSKQALCTLVPGGTCPYESWTKEQANVWLS